MTVATDILQRTFHIRHGDSAGTCFTVDVDNRRYLVTARHLVETIQAQGVVEIQHNGVWRSVAVDLVGHGEGSVDLSVLAPQSLFGATHPLVMTTASLLLSEEVYFLGFPYGLSFDAGELNSGFPMPLVKRATVSAMYLDEGFMLLDGHNNPGFSGGPVVRRWNGSEQVVLGVVSAYRSEKSRVVDDAGNSGPYSYIMNTGIVVMYDSRKLKELIASNPVGIEASQIEAQG